MSNISAEKPVLNARKQLRGEADPGSSARASKCSHNPWLWIPTTYLAEGGPYAIAVAVSVILFKSLGMDNQEVALWSSLIAMPWAFKPLWAPLLDLLSTKRNWVIGTQLTMALVLACSAFLIHTGSSVTLLVGTFLLFAMVSATHDVANDGFYLIALNSHEQSFFAGIRGTFYRIASVLAQGGLVMFAGMIERCSKSVSKGWGIALALAATVMAIMALWHIFFIPQSPGDHPARKGNPPAEFLVAFSSFLKLPGITSLLMFLLFFRLAESQLGRIAVTFMKDGRVDGGLGLSTEMFGMLYGTFGVLALIVGGIAGGVLVARLGFGYLAWILVFAMNLPDFVYVGLGILLPESPWIIGGCIAIEQFGYGLGYSAFMLVTIAFAEHSGRFKTSHFAIMTGIAILGLNLAGMLSGYVQKWLGYTSFFWYVMLCTIPSFLVMIPVIRHIPAGFGRRKSVDPNIS